jgi:hypothetical protein
MVLLKKIPYAEISKQEGLLRCSTINLINWFIISIVAVRDMKFVPLTFK